MTLISSGGPDEANDGTYRSFVASSSLRLDVIFEYYSDADMTIQFLESGQCLSATGKYKAPVPFEGCGNENMFSFRTVTSKLLCKSCSFVRDDVTIAGWRCRKVYHSECCWKMLNCSARQAWQKGKTRAVAEKEIKKEKKRQKCHEPSLFNLR